MNFRNKSIFTRPMMSNNFRKNMTKFNFMCDVVAMELLTLEIRKQRFFYTVLLYIVPSRPKLEITKHYLELS